MVAPVLWSDHRCPKSHLLAPVALALHHVYACSLSDFAPGLHFTGFPCLLGLRVHSLPLPLILSVTNLPIITEFLCFQALKSLTEKLTGDFPGHSFYLPFSFLPCCEMPLACVLPQFHAPPLGPQTPSMVSSLCLWVGPSSPWVH